MIRLSFDPRGGNHIQYASCWSELYTCGPPKGEGRDKCSLLGNVTPPVNNLLIPVSVVFQPMDWDGAKLVNFAVKVYFSSFNIQLSFSSHSLITVVSCLRSPKSRRRSPQWRLKSARWRRRLFVLKAVETGGLWMGRIETVSSVSRRKRTFFFNNSCCCSPPQQVTLTPLRMHCLCRYSSLMLHKPF